MARVLIPVTPRQYNYNPRGSSTTQVLMRADNPFERSVSVEKSQFQRRGVMLPGMGELGDDPAPAAPAAADPWAVLTQGVVDVGKQVAAKELAKPAVRKIPVASKITALPIGQPYPPPKKSKLPLIIGGVAVVGLLGALILIRRKRH